MENVENLKRQIDICKKDIERLRRRIRVCKDDLSDLYVRLFYAENGMKEGQHFMLDGKEYAKVDSGSSIFVKALPLTKSGKISLMGRNIYKHEFSKIVPLSMNK